MIAYAKHAMSGGRDWLGEDGYTYDEGPIGGRCRDRMLHALRAYLLDLEFDADHKTLTNARDRRWFWWLQVKSLNSSGL